MGIYGSMVDVCTVLCFKTRLVPSNFFFFGINIIPHGGIKTLCFVVVVGINMVTVYTVFYAEIISSL